MTQACSRKDGPRAGVEEASRIRSSFGLTPAYRWRWAERGKPNIQGGKMIRKILVIATAIAVPVGVIAATGGVAGAGGARVLQPDTLHCATEQAVAQFSIPFSSTGVTSGQEMTTISGSISD